MRIRGNIYLGYFWPLSVVPLERLENGQLALNKESCEWLKAHRRTYQIRQVFLLGITMLATLPLDPVMKLVISAPVITGCFFSHFLFIAAQLADKDLS